MKKIIRIAIDGPSGAGKSTIAKNVAKVLNIDYIDTGAMYRALGYKLSVTATDYKDKDALDKFLDCTDINFSDGNIILDGEVVNHLIRTSDVTKLASECAAIFEVRQKLTQLQRKMGLEKSVIMDGRDIGTNVLTNAEFKFFMTASSRERAERRYLELKEKGQNEVYEKVLSDIEERDHQDATRELNPLRKADDAVEIDTTGMSIEDVTNYILERVRGVGPLTELEVKSHGDC